VEAAKLVTGTSADTPDPELAVAIKQSDADAFKILYYRYYEQLFRFLWHKTRDHETSKDLVQELFFRVWKNRESVDPSKSIKAYLYKTASNLAIDLLRKKTTEQAYALENPVEETSAPEAQFDLEEKARAAIDSLPEHIHTVFCLSRIEGLKYTEIAETLHISVKTVESRMSKALKILRQKLQPFLILLLF
jgi:RNA polymerase sigma-70 factor (ECF subfamily)